MGAISASSDERERSAIKILLLGAGESGKSTLLKQMKLIHDRDSTSCTEEWQSYRELIFRNVFDTITALVDGLDVIHVGGTFIKRVLCDINSMLLNAAPVITDRDMPFNDDPIMRGLLLGLSLANNNAESQALRSYMKQMRRAGLYLMDSGEYFLQRLDMILDPKYQPTEQDILRSRVRTIGIHYTELHVEENLFRIYDVGGQRGERRKWIGCFEEVTAVMFIASLSEYDQVLAEDPLQNRMIESLNLFEGICNLSWFCNVAMILFLNKNDIFMEKIKEVDIGIYFPSYYGGEDYETARDFIKTEFLSRNHTPSRPIYTHCTTATDTENVAFVWESTKSTILRSSLQGADLLV